MAENRGGRRANAGRPKGAKEKSPRVPKIMVPPPPVAGGRGITRNLAERIDEYVDRVVAVLIKIVEDDNEQSANRLAAAAQLLDRHSGRPANVNIDLSNDRPAPREFKFIRHSPQASVTVIEPVQDIAPAARAP